MPAAAPKQPQPVRPKRAGVWVIGHRGFPEIAPENTLVSFEKAVAAGADMVEFDVTLTRDGVPVVLHDRTLNRTTDGKGSVRRKKWDEIRKLDAGSWFPGKYDGVRIPSLDETLACLRGKISLNIEIKKEAAMSKVKGGVEEKVLNAVAKYGAGKFTVVSSFDPKIVGRIKKLDPDQSAALLFFRKITKRGEKIFWKTGADAVHISKEGFEGTIAGKLRSTGVPFRVYTVNLESDMRRFIEKGADGIFTDRPAALRKVADQGSIMTSGNGAPGFAM